MAQGGQVPAEVKALDFMDGTWDFNLDMTIMGQTMTQTGTMTVSTEGMFKKMVAKGTTAGMESLEISYIGWQESKKRIQMYTFTDWAPTPREEYGTFDGKTWVTVSEPWDVPGVGVLVSRATLTKVSDKELSITIEFKNGDSWDKVGKGTYKKK